MATATLLVLEDIAREAGRSEKPKSRMPENYSEYYVKCSDRGCGRLIRAEDAYWNSYRMPYCNIQCENNSGF